MTIEPIRNVRGDWWVLAAAFEQLAAYLVPKSKKYNPNPSGHLEGDGYYVDVFGLGSIRFSGSDGRTQINVATETPESIEYWMYALERLQLFNDDARRLQREVEPTADDAIAFYYRSRAAGSRKTIRQVAEQFKMSYAALLKHKQRYDAAGKWGSKKDMVSLENRDTTDPHAY